MNYNSDGYNRQSLRLKKYNYSLPGAYFITICTQARECLFGKIEDHTMRLNDAGKMIENEWKNLKNRFPNIELDKFMVMPNHFHGILIIENVGAPLVGAQNKTVGIQNITAGAQNLRGNSPNKMMDFKNKKENIQNSSFQKDKRAGTRPAPTKSNTHSLSEIIGAFKSITTHSYISGVKNCKWQQFDKKLWQRNYYEHIIRNEESLQSIQEYILSNPLNWESDELYI